METIGLSLEEISPLSQFLLSFSDASSPFAQGVALMFGLLFYLLLFLSPLSAIGYLDRKLCGDIQMRIGPNRAGPYGILQGFADAVKFFSKIREDAGVSNSFFYITISMSLGFLVMGSINIPFSAQWVYANLEISSLFVLACLLISRLFLFWSAYRTEGAWATVSSFATLGVVVYALVPLALALLSPALMVGSLDLRQIASSQGGLPWEWMLFNGPGNFLSFLVFWSALFIWHGRAPSSLFFENSTLSAGALSEFEGRRFYLLKKIEYFSVFLSSALLVTVFLGAWNAPFPMEVLGRASNLVEALIFLGKTLLISFLMIWFRWTMPGARLKQISNLSWWTLLPYGFFGAALTMLWLALTRGHGMQRFL